MEIHKSAFSVVIIDENTTSQFQSISITIVSNNVDVAYRRHKSRNLVPLTWMHPYWKSIRNGVRQSLDRKQDERQRQPRWSRGHRRAPRRVNTASTSSCNLRRNSSTSTSSSSTAGRSKRELVSNTNRSLRLQTQRVNLFCSHSFSSCIALIQCHANWCQLILQLASTSIEIFIQNGWNVRRGQVLRRRGKAPISFIPLGALPLQTWSIFYP